MSHAAAPDRPRPPFTPVQSAEVVYFDTDWWEDPYYGSRPLGSNKTVGRDEVTIAQVTFTQREGRP